MPSSPSTSTSPTLVSGIECAWNKKCPGWKIRLNASKQRIVNNRLTKLTPLSIFKHVPLVLLDLRTNTDLCRTVLAEWEDPKIFYFKQNKTTLIGPRVYGHFCMFDWKSSLNWSRCFLRNSKSFLRWRTWFDVWSLGNIGISIQSRTSNAISEKSLKIYLLIQLLT